MKVEVCFSPALYKFYTASSGKIVVVTDIFRASTTMCAAFKNGAKAIIPVASIEEAKDYKARGYKVGAERNVKRCDFADFGNAPTDYTEEMVKGEDIVFTTTNGTQAIDTASDAEILLVGAFSNLNAVADFCIAQKKDVMVLCAGWENQFNIEDTLFGGALADVLIARGEYKSASDATQVALSMWNEAIEVGARQYVERTEHIKRLEANGLVDSVDYCLTIDTVPLVPIFDKETRKLTLV